MSPASGRSGKQRGVIDVNAIRRDLVALEFEDIGERYAERRAIVARISYHSLTNCRGSVVPDVQQLVPARGNGGKETRHDGADSIGSDNRWRVAEAKLCVRCQQINEAGSVAGINDREDPLPPVTIGPKGLLCYGSGIH